MSARPNTSVPEFVKPTSPNALGVWRLADPKIALASVVPFLVAVAVARHGGGWIAAGLFVGALVALLAVEVAKNAVNDVFDFRSGVDLDVREEERTPFSGGKRVIVDRLLTEEETLHVGVLSLVIALVAGVIVAALSYPELLVLGALGAAVAIAYTAPPLKLAYRGLGELAVFAAYGPGIVLGTVYLFTGRVLVEAVWISVALGLLVAGILLVNELPDERPDRGAGKRTLVVRLGRHRALYLLGAVFATAFAVALFGATATTPRLLALLAGSPFAAIAMLALARSGDGPIPVKAQTSALLAFVSAGLATMAAFLL